MKYNTEKRFAIDSNNHSKELLAILELNKKIHERYSVEGVIESAIEALHNILAPDLILFYMRYNNKLKLMASGPPEVHTSPNGTFSDDNDCCLFDISAKTGTPVFSKELRNEPLCTCGCCQRGAFSSLASLPLMSKSGVIGVLGLISFEERDFSTDHIFLETAVKEITVSIKNLLSMKKLKTRLSKLESQNEDLIRGNGPREKEPGISREMLQQFFDGMPNPMMLLDNRLRIKMINQAARKHYRLPHEFEPGNSACYQLFWNRSTPCKGCRIASNLHCTAPFTFERKSMFKPDGTLEVTLIPLITGTPETTQYIEYISDISKEKRIEQELQQADKMISLGILVSGVAHEINNPNNWTMMNTPILSEIWAGILPILNDYHERNGDFNAGGLPYLELREAVPRLLEGILDGSKRITKIVRELKNYSRVEPDKNRAQVDIVKSLKNAVNLVSKQIEKSSDTFSVTYGENIPPIHGNSQKIEQVVVNLLLNACQALPGRNSGISLSAFFDEASNNVVVSVCDEGVGIPETVLPRIMDPFFTTKRHKGGTGLGLSVSSKIVQDHGGKLKVISKPGKGSTFSIFLPTEQRNEKIKVLVADDEKMIREVIVESLHRTKRYFVKEAANGVETCFMLAIEAPDIVILDINMPDMDGLDVCRQIQKTPSLSDLKVIIITGNHLSDKARAIAEMGFCDILQKPISTKSITDMVEAVMRKKETVQ